MKRCTAAVLMALAISTSAWSAAPEDSVVKVFSTMRPPNPVRPWSLQDPVEVHGSGVLIQGKRILTNAHLVLYADEIEVQGRRGGKRIEATVESVGPAIDLAVLKLSDEAFFADRPILARASELPALTSGVAVYGYPTGGTGLSITRGVVSRIDYAYLDVTAAALQVQVDAAINPGNSGGPAVVDGKMIGLVFGQGENIGYVLANEEIDTFLNDVKDGHYHGKPRLLDNFQQLVNPALRAKLRVPDQVEGVMVRQPAKEDADYPLHENDVVVRIGDQAIDNEGMVSVSESLRLPFMYFVPKLAHDDRVPLAVIRDGKTLELSVPVVQGDHRLIHDYSGEPQPYFVCGPMIFSPVLAQAIAVYYRANPVLLADASPLTTRRVDRPRFPGEELVVVTAPLLRHKITKGYSDPFGQVVHDVNGIEVKNLLHLVELIRDSRDEFLTFRFSGKLAESIVFYRQELLDSTARLMAQNGIPRVGTDDVMKVWEKKPPAPR